ncbi:MULTISPECIES: hypothetical protein [unclassified Pseudofrankia]|uniref:hypothetical protein n=1 Tax=unclassified Pseudofrankia TaxID=2994372 RepID=UPI0008D990E7|nr:MULTISPECIES: hypothetical protein [unclassified Pseudofrankia]MDT3440622.1 hypothetical protein [Pseudofrankia sp. BMG5.37]OHV60555.1 hypothetical protein BCD48_05315 [Pseudofrankia sp. BMG5.36]
MLPLSACAAEIEAKRLRHAPLREPALTQQLGTAVTGHLELPRGFAIRVSEIIREEAVRLVESGVWNARLCPPRRGSYVAAPGELGLAGGSRSVTTRPAGSPSA